MDLFRKYFSTFFILVNYWCPLVSTFQAIHLTLTEIGDFFSFPLEHFQKKSSILVGGVPISKTLQTLK